VTVLNYNHLFYFHVAASEGSLAKAAERLGVTQPTVSEQIRQLEKKLGVRLFHRSTTGLRLTEQGRAAYEHTTPMFRAGELLMQAIGPAQVQPSAKPLRVGVTPTVLQRVSRELLVPLFSGPGEDPSIRTGGYPDLLQALRRHELDALLCESEPVGVAGEGLRVTEIHRPRLVAIASPHTDVRENWHDAALIQYPPGCALRHDVEQFLTAHALEPRTAGETDDPLLMLEAVRRTRAVACVPMTIAREAIARGEVRALALLEPNGSAVYAISHDGQVVLLAIERLIQYAKQELGGGGGSIAAVA
jgi:LysR family transcriptional regulator, transcriptional activator of nhaA